VRLVLLQSPASDYTAGGGAVSAARSIVHPARTRCATVAACTCPSQNQSSVTTPSVRASGLQVTYRHSSMTLLRVGCAVEGFSDPRGCFTLVGILTAGYEQNLWPSA
jgi:hypothetical protein